jgi:hypothetical protein
MASFLFTCFFSCLAPTPHDPGHRGCCGPVGGGYPDAWGRCTTEASAWEATTVRDGATLRIKDAED